MGRGKKRMAASLATAQKQAQLQALPLIKKPIELIGKSIKVPGSYWEGHQTADEKKELYVCHEICKSNLHSRRSPFHVTRSANQICKAGAHKLETLSILRALEHGLFAGIHEYAHDI